MSALPSDLTFWLVIPALLLVLFFAWLIFISRGARSTRISLSGLGISLTIDSAKHTQEGEENVK